MHRFQVKHIRKHFFFLVSLFSINIFLNWLISCYIFQFYIYPYEPFSVFVSQAYIAFYAISLSFVVYPSYFALHYFYPFILAIFLMGKTYNGSSLSAWFFYLIAIRLVLSILLTSCVSFLLLLNFFYPLYIYTHG